MDMLTMEVRCVHLCVPLHKNQAWIKKPLTRLQVAIGTFEEPKLRT